MSQQVSGNQQQFVKKPKWDIYTTLLFISLAAVITGIVFLHLEMDRYKYVFRKSELPSVDTSSIDQLPESKIITNEEWLSA